ncbi:MAG: GTPase HflX, partial [Candidatus Omnitrophica bacterium]|nr:GTPase HflX [Candidatus Omnitrophota bacterium]
MSERALVVTVVFPDPERLWEPEDFSKELERLALSAGTEVAGAVILRPKEPHPKTLIGQGHAENLRDAAQRARADTVVLGAELTASQQRNLEEIIGAKTIDRTQLILDIFARRARSVEGQIQVELAQLTYLLPRLVGQGIILSRLGGGIGTRGPGEQKLETNRRRIRERIAHLKKDLKRVAGRRERTRAKRRLGLMPVGAVVGYTNAGKSTLFNALTGASVISRNQLFSTLDPTVRKIRLEDHEEVLLVDTVGFLHSLPHHLIEAFKATLEEVTQADFLVHVIDASHPRSEVLEQAAYEVLEAIGSSQKPTLMILNKMDLLQEKSREFETALLRRFPGSVQTSAL